MNLLNQHIEALIFCSEQSISLDEIAASLKLSFDWEPSELEILESIEQIRVKYLSEDFSFELAEISEGYQFLTKKEYHATISALIQHKSKKRLSVAQMETLSIIAYKQPVTKSEVEHIRGVNCDYAVQKLLEKELIEISGKSDGPGRPVLYTTSKNFMDYFGIKSVKDLPQLKDIHVEQNEIGQASDMMDAEETELVQESAEIVAEPVDVVKAETPEMVEEVPESVVNDDSTDTAAYSELENETIVEDDLPVHDRKAIFLQNETSQEETSSEENISGFLNED